MNAGSYQVIVSNVAGDTASDEVVVRVLSPAELRLQNYAGLTVLGVPGRTYRIEAAVDPQGPWQQVGAITLELTQDFWVDRDSPAHPTRVYRAVEMP